MSRIKWAYGVTTVPERASDLLPRTLSSLRAAGFDNPRLFVDGTDDPLAYYTLAGEVTVRQPKIRTFGNWALALGELVIRTPNADRYAIFQDDFVTYKNLRRYLDYCSFPEKGYWNLYTFPSNQELAPDTPPVWYEARGLNSTSPTPDGKQFQTGRGAVALVFDRQGTIDLLTHQHFVTKPTEAAEPWKRVDGCVVTAMNKAGYREFVHSPSLVQHTGKHSSMGNPPHLLAVTFLGEDFDAREWVK